MHSMPLAPARHPAWCRPSDCELPGPHLGPVSVVKSSGDDAVLRTRPACWPAEQTFPAQPGVMIELELTCFTDRALRAFLTLDDAAAHVRAVLAAVEQAQQP
ncbi:MAG: hypothetical protein JWP11_3403 [Frankiales bacterium]|nr:hypothetical protein [Frankiales bacterium]